MHRNRCALRAARPTDQAKHKGRLGPAVVTFRGEALAPGRRATASLPLHSNVTRSSYPSDTNDRTSPLTPRTSNATAKPLMHRIDADRLDSERIWPDGSLSYKDKHRNQEHCPVVASDHEIKDIRNTETSASDLLAQRSPLKTKTSRRGQA